MTTFALPSTRSAASGGGRVEWIYSIATFRFFRLAKALPSALIIGTFCYERS